MQPSFHLSIGLRRIDEAAAFFVDVLGATVTHRDPSGYVNIDLRGTQITLKSSDAEPARDPHFHFGLNLAAEEFDRMLERVRARAAGSIVAGPSVADEGTPMERKKVYLACPGGYTVELKGYPRSGS